MGEIEYRDLGVCGFPGYRVGSDGSVWSQRQSGQWRLRKPNKVTPQSRAVMVQLAIAPGKYRSASVPRLVLQAFGQQPPELSGWEAGYKDGQPENVSLDNLIWIRRAKKGGRGHGVQRGPVTDGVSLWPVVSREIAARRAQHDLRVAEAARAAGLTPHTWYQVEFGAGWPSCETFLRVCIALGCTPTELLPSDWRERLAATLNLGEATAPPAAR